MKRLPLIILFFAVLVAVVTGCSRAPRYDSRLAAADSLMRSAPDSALALVEGVCRDSLAAECDRAYRDLLLTQARYRCYVTATSDSDINRALAYYRAHQGEREKLTRAYIYKGAVMEELNHPDSAMCNYKQAEHVADTADHFNLGYANLRIAELYQSIYVNDSAVVDRMKQAENHFTIINDTNYLIVTAGVQGALLFDSDPEAAKSNLEKAIDMGTNINSPRRFNYQSKLSGYYFYKTQDYVKAKDLAMDIINNGADECDEYQFYYYAARSFIRLNDLDSARYVRSIIPTPMIALDSMNHYQLEAELAQAEHRYSDYAVNQAKAKDINDRLDEKSLQSNISNAEFKYDAEKLTDDINKSKSRSILRLSILALLAVAIVLAVAHHITRRLVNRYQNQIEKNRQLVEQLIDEITDTTNRLEAEKAFNSLQISQLDNKSKELEESNKRLKELEVDYENRIFQKENELIELSKKNEDLMSKQRTIHQQVLTIVQDRISALNDLYQAIYIKGFSGQDSPKHTISLIGMIRELNEKKKLLQITPSKPFWEKLKQSIDSELNGIATFVEKKYPSMDEKEFKLFLLLCADVSPQIIKLCLGYDHAVTVSNYKIRLVKRTFGINARLDEYIQMYLDGKLG